MFITPEEKALQYSGRIDFDNPSQPEFVFPCSYVKICFVGTKICAVVENHHNCWDNYLGYILDGEQGKCLLPEEGRVTLTLGEQLEDTRHELLLFKRMDSCHTLTFYGFELSEGSRLLPTEPKPQRRIEVYGDSVSAGEVSEAVDYMGKEDPPHQGEYSNSWYSYAWMTARKLNAEIHDIAQGGIPLLDGTGWFADPHFCGMESVYDKVRYHPMLGESKTWDFKRYTPHVVIVALGQNDNHPYDYMAQNYLGQDAINWKREYLYFIKKLRKLYPKAEIILTTTILEHHANWDKAIDEVCLNMQDEKVHHFYYTQNGCGTKGHIRIMEAEQMAEELAAYITSLGEEVWTSAEQEEIHEISNECR